MRIGSLFILISLYWINFSNAQINYFNNRYDLTGQGSVSTSLLQSNNKIIISGVGVDSALNVGICLLAIDSVGVEIWKKKFCQPGKFFFPGYSGTLIKTTDNGFALAGGVSDTSGNNDIVLFRFDSIGDTLWTRTIGTSNFETGAQCKQSPDGGFIIIGTSFQNGFDDNVELLKTDSLGNIQWQKFYGGSNTEYGYTVDFTNDGGYIIGGITKSFGMGDFDTYFIKTDSLGNQQWQKVFGGIYFDSPAFVKQTISGDFILTCSLTMFQINGYDQAKSRIIKMDNAGNVVWDKTYGPARYGTELYRIQELNSGDFIVVGQRTDTTGTPVGNGFPEGIILRINSQGDSVWYRVVENLSGPNSENYLRDIYPLNNSGFAAAGFVIPVAPDTGSENIWVTSIDYCGCGFINCDTLCSLTGIYDSGNHSLGDLKIYPNPTETDVTFEFDNFNPPYSIVLYDVFGRELKTINNKYYKLLEIDLSNLAGGIYFYKVSDGDQNVFAGRLIIR